jgi:protein-S-isoprenylcysteine O-methyltransferase Ste14
MVWKKTGVNPVVFKGSDSAHDFIGRVFKLLFTLIVFVVFIHSFFPGVYEYLVPVPWLQQPWIRVTGIVCLIASLAWTVVAQAHMGESWRIGVDSERKTTLVNTGVFRISRNPIYFGMILTLIGLLLVIPNAFTLLIFVMGVVLINIQVRLEEEYLKTSHGEEYVRYQQTVGRWI